MKITLTPKTLGMILQGIAQAPPDGSKQVELSDVKSSRSDAQRRLQFMWITDIAKQTHETKEEVEYYCKLTFGIPILLRDNEEFAEIWPIQSDILTYENKLKAMAFLPVTRLMSVRQNTEYLEDLKHHYQNNDIVLPEPDDLMYSAFGKKR